MKIAKDVGNLRTKLSFEKTGDSNLTDLSRDLKGLRSEMNNFRSSGRAYRTSVQGMRRESDILTRRLQAQRERVAELKRRYDEARKATGENSARTKDLAAQYNNAQAEMKRTEGQLNRLNDLIRTQESRWTQLGQRMEEYGQKMQTLGRATSSFGRAYTMRVTTPILGAGIAALKVGMDFEEGMSKVQAISGATGEELGKMRDQAKELGESTRFSAREAADGMEFLARAGWDTTEIMAGMPGLLDLAASSAMDLGRAADITSNIMSAFNLEAEKAGYIADVLSHAAANANTDVEQMGEAMKYVAPTANTLGLGIEETAAAIMAVSDAGIQGSQAGRAFGTSLLRLSDPTSKMQKEMDKLKLSFFDAEGQMKELPDIIGQLETAMSDYDKEQRAATLSTLFGTEAQRHWSLILDQGSKKLSDNTKELKGAEGAAAEMAKTMQDNAKGAMIEFRSALEGAGIAAAEHVIPAITDITKRATELIRKFGELDKEQQRQILKWLGITAAIGPAAMILGTLMTSFGGVLRLGGNVARMLGRSGGAGLIGRLGLLGGPVGVATIAGVGVAFLGKKLYDTYRESQKLNDVSTETADKLWEQADALDNLVSEFDSLRSNAALSNDEFGRMIDIQKELEITQNPARIAELNDEYEKLREKSGLSNEQIEAMIGLNNDIIDQSPNVEKSFTNQGNAIIESTDAVKEYINSLKEMALIELQAEQAKALENETKLRQENKEINEEIAQIERDINELIELRNMPLEEVDTRLEEINEKLNSGQLTMEEYTELEREQALLLQLQNDNLVEALESLQNQREELIKKRDLNDDELAKLEQINSRMAELLLSEVEINFEKGKGLDVLDERIEKLRNERQSLIDNATEEEKRTGAINEQLNKLSEQIVRHENIRDKIKEETGYQSEKISKQDEHNRQLEFALSELKAMTPTQQATNRKIDIGTGKAKELTEEANKKARKEIEVDDKGGVDKVNREASKSITKRVTLSAMWTGVRSGLSTALRGFGFPGFADGTKHAPGGPAWVGEEGFELARLGDRWSMLDFGLANIPKGTEIFTHEESKRILRTLNNLPRFASGTNMGSETNRMVSGLNNPVDNEKIIYLLQQIVKGVTSGKVIVMNGKKVAKEIEPHMTDIQNRHEINKNRARGFMT